MDSDPIRHLITPGLGSLFLFSVIGGVFLLLSGDDSFSDLATQMMINTVVVLGLQIYIGNTGILSFGHIGFGAISGYAFAIFAVSPSRKLIQIPNAPLGLAEINLTPFQSGIAAIAITLVIAIIVGLALSRSGARSGSVAAVVITLALLFVVHEVATNWIDLTRGGKTGLSFSPFGGNTLQGSYPIILLLFAAIAVARLFKETRAGRLAQAAREDDLVARAMGINPAVQQMIALLLSVAVVAAGSAMRVYEIGSISPRLFFFDYTLLTLTMLIVGGRYSVTGAVAGVLVITAGKELTRNLAELDVDGFNWFFRDGLTDIFLGAAMLGFMIMRPAGLLGDWEFDHWLLRRFKGAKSPVPVSKPTIMTSAQLKADSVSVHFGGFIALDDAALTAKGGEVVGLIGPNGAGKTTLLNVITGLVQSDNGTVLIGSNSLTGLTPIKIARAGLARTFQNIRLFPALSVRENVEVIRLVAHRHRQGKEMPSTDSLLVKAGLWDQKEWRASELDYGNGRRLELARAAAAGPDFLLLDEPTSGMSDSESIDMIAQVRTMAELIGAGVVVIDHDLNFITGICDRVYVLDQGRVIAEGSPAEISNNPLVLAAYLGEKA
ncbi:MAG: ATP-binding cassette domain-containing protein [Arenicellales bacterium]|jgi:branched-chain amino acid transport system permease protein|nr:ATP-binding cassette domain-containing protein [Arenicellales bacterium]MDP7481676.1 ATP-binding cassette domain-containing protein [Arenicellales bacterium]HJL66161.1 ATP-binding cassette domain-containing protein [Arenicellales bacterium]